MKLNIKSAVSGRTSQVFSPYTLASLDFGRLQPMMLAECIPSDEYSFDGKGLMRIEPQVFPPFGRLSVRSASFFVPDYQIVSSATAFHANLTTFKGVPTQLPRIKNYWLNAMFATNIGPDFSTNYPPLATLVASNPAIADAPLYMTDESKDETYDFVYPYNISYPVASDYTGLCYYKMTDYGRKIYAIAKSLGYDFLSMTYASTSDTQASYFAKNECWISAMPLLAYFKIYSDYFLSGPEYNTNPVSVLCNLVYNNKDVTFPGTSTGIYTASSASFNISGLKFIRNYFDYCRVQFEQNLYTTAWNNTNAPLDVVSLQQYGTNNNSIISPVSSSTSNSIRGNSGSISVDSSQISHSTSSPVVGTFTSKGHDWLMAFDRYVRRKNLVGTHAIRQIYAQFGINPSQAGFMNVIKIQDSSSRVTFNAITSTSDTKSGSSGKALGAYGGQGISGLEFKFNYKSDCHGYIICLSWLSIDPILEKGMKPHVLRTSPLDYYNPEFDGKAYRPIPYSEVSGCRSTITDLSAPTKIYGYTNIYDDYRQIGDIVCGAFADKTTRDFAFMRDLSAIVLAGRRPQDAIVKYYNSYTAGIQLSNPFLNDDALDRFYIGIDWTIRKTSNIKSSEDAFELGMGDTTVVKNGDMLS